MPEDETDEPGPNALGAADRHVLDRLAWGAGTDAELRDAAMAELRRRDGVSDAGGPDPASAAATDSPEDSDRPAPAGGPDVFGDAVPVAAPEPIRSAEQPVRPARRRILIGAVALAAGAAVLAGASYFTRSGDQAAGEDGITIELQPDEAGAAGDVGDAQRGTAAGAAETEPAETTRALNVFARDQVPDDLPDNPPPALEPKSFRLLYTDPSGWSGYTAMRRTELCLMVRTPEGSDFFTCALSIGEFLDDGSLRLSFSIDGRQTDVRWRRDGAFHLFVRN